MTVCPQCGQENPEGARFCFSCGTELRAEAAREERKVVSVLFADLVGFTSRAEQMDPEDVRAVLAPYHARLRAELEAHGGTVEKFIGDAVMALFGAPTAHEDDPERAVRAALAIRDWIRDESELELRVAVTTGEALIDSGARPSEGEGMASGDVVNTAARLQAAAPTNGILVDQATYRSTEAAIVVRRARACLREGKGGADTGVGGAGGSLEIRNRHCTDLAERRSSGASGRSTSCSARSPEHERSDEPQLVTLVGVPGIGKSRLVVELAAEVDGRARPHLLAPGALAALRRGHLVLGSQRNGQGAGGILETDSPDDAAAKLKRSAGDFSRTETATGSRVTCGPWSGSTETGGARGSSRRGLRGVETVLRVDAEERPLVLVFEDLHWADEGLLDFIDHLVEWASGVPMLVVCTARPELLPRRSGWGGGKPNAATLSLSPLSDDETARLIGALLERSVLPAEMQSRSCNARAEIRSTRRSSRAWSPTGGWSPRRSCRCRSRSRASLRPAWTGYRSKRRLSSRTLPW